MNPDSGKESTRRNESRRLRCRAPHPIPPNNQREPRTQQHHGPWLWRRGSFVMAAAMFVNFSVFLEAESDGRTGSNRRVWESKSTQSLLRKGLANRQIRQRSRLSNRKRRTERLKRNRLVQHILVRLLIGNLRLRYLGNLIAALGARRDLAVGQQQFACGQPNLLARPENCVANAIGKVD